MVEVALVLPIFIFTLMAVLEMGYFVAVGSAVSSASREAARYAATVGTVDPPGPDPAIEHSLYCDGIRAAASRTSGALVTLDPVNDIDIDYDDGLSTTPYDNCPAGGPAPAVDDVDRWDRIAVTVTYTYEPITPLLRPIMGTQVMTSTDRRSIVKSCSDC